MRLREGDIGMLHRAPATSLKRCCTTIVEWYNAKITVAGIPSALFVRHLPAEHRLLTNKSPNNIQPDTQGIAHRDRRPDP